ncbi:MAG: AbrB/MazE/SpoVT family DNA-binding domain-containing protein [Spirochaetes bacterium]|nr:AbrB/MazE/SpoVT family DNA-binding domain-containing protein [Spirochaetota bacterium]
MSIATITKKGQITLPAQFRKQLKTNVVLIE